MNDEIIQDLKTFSIRDLNSLIKYYKIDPKLPTNTILNELVNKIYKKGNIETRNQEQKRKEIIALLSLYSSSNAPKILELLKDTTIQWDHSKIGGDRFHGFLQFMDLHVLTDDDIRVLSWLLNYFTITMERVADYLIYNKDVDSFKKIIRVLKEKGQDLNEVDIDGDNIIFSILNQDFFDVDLLQYLIDQGIDIHHRNNRNQTVLCAIKNIRSGIPDREIINVFKLLFKYLDYFPSRAGCDITRQQTFRNKKLMLQALKEVYQDKLSALQENLEIALDSLNLLFDENQKTSLLSDLETMKKVNYSKKGRSIIISLAKDDKLITIDTFNKLKNEYEKEKELLEKKIKYLYDAIELYPGGKTYKEGKQRFEREMSIWSIKNK